MSKKQLQIIKRRRQLLAFFILLVIIVLGLVIFSVNSSAHTEKESYKYYTSYEVMPGDTLWTIADRFMSPEYRDKESYIAEVKQMNHMLDDDLEAGDFLMLAYYSYDNY